MFELGLSAEGQTAALDARAADSRCFGRPVIARSAKALFPGSLHLKRHSLPLPGGWYLGTNISKGDAERILRFICTATGLPYMIDLVPNLVGPLHLSGPN